MIIVRDAFRGWMKSPIIIKTIERYTVDFVEVTKVTGEEAMCMVQPVTKTDLNADTLDWSRDHKYIYSFFPIPNGRFVEYRGKDYKVVEFHDWGDAGYYRATCEETKKKLIEVDEYV